MKAKILTCLVVAPLLNSISFAAGVTSVSEPETVFYGRILDRSGPVDHIVTEGTLSWLVKKADGSTISLSSTLFPLKNGEFSYSLRVPHEVLSLGLTASPRAVALGTAATLQTHLQISLDGFAATIVSPGESSFDAAQALRAMTYRLDLEVKLPLLDSDHDGMPDWWEDANGLDKQNAVDASGDIDGDGTTNKNEYLAGTSPQLDSRFPKLLTKEIVAYAGSTTAVLLETSDTDSSPAQLTYTITNPPAEGQLKLRNSNSDPANPDKLLTSGSTFTQDDVARGRLNFVHAITENSISFGVKVADEKPSHGFSSGTIQVLVYDPSPGAPAANEPEALRLAAFAAATGAGTAIVADLGAQSGSHKLAAPSGGLSSAAYTSTYLPAFGSDRPHFIIGGAHEDAIGGGMADDSISGGPGVDTLTGGGGADKFIYTGITDGNDTITDFKTSEGDALDLRAVLVGTSSLTTDYIRITRSGADALVGVDADGAGGTFSDLVIRFSNSTLQQSDLRSLVEGGNLITGAIGLLPQLTISAPVPRASENGVPAGRFAVSRSKAGSQPLTVSLSISGSATNGVDYPLLPPTVVIPPDALSVNIDILPYVDSIAELDETILITLVAQPTYELGSVSAATVTIDDLKPQVTIEPLNPLAEVTTQNPASFLLARTGVVDRSVLVRLTIAGNATNGVDYNRIDNFFNLAPNQTAGVIQITPKSTAVLQNGAESVILTVNADATYRVGNPSKATVVLVSEELNLESWGRKNFASIPSDTEAFSKSDPGGIGVPMLLRYAFGLNPANPQQNAASLMPKPELRDGHLAIRFKKLPAAMDLNYQIEVSDDLVHWKHSGTEVEDISQVESLGDPTGAVFRCVQGTQAGPRYMRVRVVRNQP